MLEAFRHDRKSVLEAQRDAQSLAFAPLVFQAARVARDSGLLAALEGAPEGVTIAVAGAQCRLGTYAAQVILESCLGAGIVLSDEQGRYRLSRVGWYVLHDQMTRVNMNFSHDVCYRGAFHLDRALAEGRPAGLRELGPWPTLYSGLMDLPEETLRSWMDFDHFYSDSAYAEALPVVLGTRPKNLVDVGGNTGQWSLACLKADSALQVLLVDLPAQATAATAVMRAEGFADRFTPLSLDLRDPYAVLPEGCDAIWMSQLLDCFAEAEVLSVLAKARAAMRPQSRLWILEPCWDRQKWETAALCLQHLSLYFTIMANGNSKMFHSRDLERLLREAGLTVVKSHDGLGVGGHTLWECRLPVRAGS